MANVKWIDSVIWDPAPEMEQYIRQMIEPVFERYAYGREYAPTTGRKHLQFRGVLKAPLDAEMIGMLGSLGFRDITPTHVKNFDYIYKDGDYFRSWDLYRPEFKDIEATPRDWQVQLEAMPTDDRTIEWISDDAGNTGKTSWAMYMQYSHKAIYCPPVSRGLDLIAFALQREESSWYIIDLPRSFNPTAEWATALEQLKNGYIYDTRYTFRDRMLKARPRVTVMANYPLTDDTFFSHDRILQLQITPKGYLWEI